MGLADAEDDGPRPLSSDGDESRSLPGKTAARCWALLLARIFEYLPLVCTRCGAPMCVIAFILDPPVVERILGHIGEPTEAPAVFRLGLRLKGSCRSTPGSRRPAQKRGRRSIRPVAATTAGGETRGMVRSGGSVRGSSAGGGGVCPVTGGDTP